MSLSRKTILIISVTLCVLIGVLLLVSRLVLLQGFASVEHHDAVKNVQRVREALSQNIDNIATKSADWAKWDDTYSFIEETNFEYLKANLSGSALTDLGLDMMLFVNEKRHVVAARFLSSSGSIDTIVPTRLALSLFSDSLLFKHDSLASVHKGVISCASGLLLFASRPIIQSDGNGPIRGTLIFGQFLDNDEFYKLSQLTHMSLFLVNSSADTCRNKFRNKQNAEVDQIHITVTSLDTLIGHLCLADFHGVNVGALEAHLPRIIYHQGVITLIYLFVFILLSGLCFGVVVVILLKKLVLARLDFLRNDVSKIAESADHSLRVAVQGVDELAMVGNGINSMLAVLQKAEYEVQAHRKEICLLLNSVPVGLLSLNESLIVNPAYSFSVESILGNNKVSGKSFVQLLLLDNPAKEAAGIAISEFLQMFRDEVLPEYDMIPLNPFPELAYSDSQGRVYQWLRLKYYLIDRGQCEPKHILVSIEDITEKKKLSERIAESERENQQLRAIAEDPDLFTEYVDEISGMVTQILAKIRDLSSPQNQGYFDTLAAIFRDVHTIKGTAGAFGLGGIAHYAGTLENHLASMSKQSHCDEDHLAQVIANVTMLSTSIGKVVESTRRILGDSISDHSDQHIRISLNKIQQQTDSIRDIITEGVLDYHQSKTLSNKVVAALRPLQSIPAQRGLAKALKIIPGLSRRLGKKVDISFIGGDVEIEYLCAHALNTVLVHLIRNSFDHGIEEGSDRIAAGKSLEGHLRIAIQHENNTYTIIVSDDGRGLDAEYLRSHAVENGILSEIEARHLSKDECHALIFLPGFTTAKGVSEISGRGIGMDAVNTEIADKLGGTIRVDSEIGCSTTFTIEIPESL